MHHRLTEKYHALFFHLERLGDDPIGTAAFRRATEVTKQGSFYDAPVEPALLAFMRSAYCGAYADAPADDKWSSWVRSFRHFGWLVSTPMARRNSQKKRKDSNLRWRYFENHQFNFWQFYAQAEKRLAELCNLGFDYFTACDFSAAAEDAFVAAAGIDDLAEPGRIDPQTIASLPPLPIVDVGGRLAPSPAARIEDRDRDSVGCRVAR
jgi:hypothetical protein